MRSNQVIDKDSNEEIAQETPAYPTRSNRYSLFGWNRNAQYCYQEEDLSLLQRIYKEYKLLPEKNKHEEYFLLADEKRWNDWWICEKPMVNPAQQGSEVRSFTLPNREAKDAKTYPVWSYADSMARQIANWQAERVKHQDSSLMNDPVMLVLEEIKYWFFDELSLKECQAETISCIAARQNYINKLTYMIPDFGPDKLYFRKIQQSLESASQTVVHCIANKELPTLLSDLISHGKSLETAIGTYLHFLLIDEEVSQNFSHDYMVDEKIQCKSSSPVCKMYQSVGDKKNDLKQDKALVSQQKLNKFYELIHLEEAHDETHVQIKLKKEAIKSIKFASFVSENDKSKYLEVMATLESLISARNLFEKFQDILPRVGTYLFAFNYLDNVNALSINYNKLVNKAKQLLNELIDLANTGLNKVWSQSGKAIKFDKIFESNLRALETRVAQDTTIKIQLDMFGKKAIDSMHKYQQEMKKLVANLHSGSAADELKSAMHNLFLQINQLNYIIPAQLAGGETVVSSLLSASSALSETAVEDPTVQAIYYMQNSAAQSVKPSVLWNGFGLLGVAKNLMKAGYHYFFSENDNKALCQLPMLSEKKPEIIGRKTESSFNQPLSLVEKFQVAQYVFHFMRKYSHFTLPWNRVRALSFQEEKELYMQQRIISECKKNFYMQKTSAAAKCKLFEDQYQFVEKNIRYLEYETNRLFQKRKSTTWYLSEVRNKLSRVKEIMHKISLENKAVKKIRAKARCRRKSVIPTCF